ncbi:uncharacterized protein LOC128226990 isoform X2 [Mya arenaria]|uniref:uncharacterized protein LOC128226990 isoform X2 n=1 Tax=Mya arenaria TaxID=6604 RepID=UPI0022E36CA1|nr:uncharacterized protein LOC128226990 isoform X2 [Mya arenaria]
MDQLSNTDLPIATGQGRIFVSQKQYMTNAEFQALCSCKEEIILQIDPLVVSSTLRRKYPRFENVYQIIHYLEPSDREIASKMLIRDLPQKICFFDFVDVLEECGYKILAEKLYLSLFKQNTDVSVKHIHTLTSSQRPVINEMIDYWKMMVDDAQFTNPRLKLSELRDKFILQMNNERNVDQRQFLADKCVAIIVAEIDAFAITFDKGLYKGHLFTIMNGLISKTSNSVLTYVFYFGRLANAYAIAGRLDESEKMLEAARCKAVHICCELSFMFYIEVQVKLHSFERTPTVDERRDLLIWGRMGIECAEQYGKKTWRRSFVLRMVFCLLGLGNRANVIENCPVDKACITEAKELLADIDRNWTGIETRRKMFYYLARGRIAELTKEYQDSLYNLQLSMNLANEGHFFEFGSISAYFYKMKYLTNQTLKHTDNTSWRETETEVLDDMIFDETRNNFLIKFSSFDQSLNTISIRTFVEDETIPKVRLNSPVTWNSTSNLSVRLPLSGRTSFGNSDADSFTKPKCLICSEHPYHTQEHLHQEDPDIIEMYGTFDSSELFMSETETETRIPPAGRDSAGNTPCQTRERSSDSQEDDEKERNTGMEHLIVSENLSSLDSNDMFGD